MKSFIDTASVQEIRGAASLGLLDGVTTNPSLLSKEQDDPREILRELAAHPLTEIGLERFLAEWEQVKNRT